MSIFTEADYEALHELVFRSDYSGYKPDVVEIPNGDAKPDTEKRFAHVAPKYMANPWQRAALMPYLERAHEVAIRAMYEANDPLLYAFKPDIRYGALRVLDYPPGAISNRHQDFDLYTLMCFRDQPEMFRSDETDAGAVISAIRKHNSQAHLGELAEVIGLGAATPHWVLPSEMRQRSIVYFTIPDHDLVLPNRLTVRAWLNERMARSRTKFEEYK